MTSIISYYHDYEHGESPESYLPCNRIVHCCVGRFSRHCPNGMFEYENFVSTFGITLISGRSPLLRVNGRKTRHPSIFLWNLLITSEFDNFFHTVLLPFLGCQRENHAIVRNARSLLSKPSRTACMATPWVAAKTCHYSAAFANGPSVVGAISSINSQPFCCAT